MAIIYNEGERGFPVPYNRINAVAGYLKHMENLLYLQFIAQNSDQPLEKRQALKEMTIAERKMEWMKKHPNFVLETVLASVDKLKKQWAK